MVNRTETYALKLKMIKENIDEIHMLEKIKEVYQ